MRKSPPNPQLSAAHLSARLALAFVFLFTPVGLVLPSATTATAATPLAAPGSLSLVSRSRSALALAWSTVDGADGYQVRWSTRSSMSSSKSRILTEPRVEIGGLSYHRKYYVQVRAVDATGAALSPYSVKKSYYTLYKSGFKVLAPTGLSATPVDSNYLRLTFSPRSGAAKYLIRYSKSASFNPVDRLTVTSNSVLIPALESSTSYYFSLRALTSSGSSMSYYSPSIKATTGAAYQSTVVPGSDPSRQVRLASYNVKCYGCEESGEAGWVERRAGVISQIAAQEPDVIGIQEASQGQMGSNPLSQFEDIQTRLGNPYRLTNAYRYNCKTSTTSGGCSYVDRGASQAARIIYNAEQVKLLSAGSIQLAYVSAADNKRFLAWGVFQQIATGKTFVFGTAHLQPDRGNTTSYNDAYTKLRKTQATQIRTKLASLSAANGGAPAIMTGDFNSRWTSIDKDGKRYNGPYQVFRDAKFTDPLNSGSEADRAVGPTVRDPKNFEYFTCNSYKRMAPRNVAGTVGTNIDYILLSAGVRASAWETVVDVDSSTGLFNGVIPSDHNLIRADVTLP